MPELNEELAKTIDDLITQCYAVYNKDHLEPSLSLLRKAWDLLPTPKENWQESYYISKNTIHAYLQSGDLEKVTSYLPTFMACDQANRNYGESEFFAAKLAFDSKEEAQALDYFVIAAHKGGSRIFNGSENKKYKDFYKKNPATAAKVKAYKDSLKPKKIVPKVATLVASDYTEFRQLKHPENGKICQLAYRDKQVFVALGKPEKIKITEKEFPTKDAAILYWRKKEVELLKKGFIYKNPAASAGMATLHRFIGTGYTGALSFEPSPNGIYISKVCWDNKSSKEDIKDALVLIDNEGILKEQIDLPKSFEVEDRFRAIQDLKIKLYDKKEYLVL